MLLGEHTVAGREANIQVPLDNMQLKVADTRVFEARVRNGSVHVGS